MSGCGLLASSVDNATVNLHARRYGSNEIFKFWPLVLGLRRGKELDISTLYFWLLARSVGMTLWPSTNNDFPQ